MEQSQAREAEMAGMVRDWLELHGADPVPEPEHIVARIRHAFSYELSLQYPPEVIAKIEAGVRVAGIEAGIRA